MKTLPVIDVAALVDRAAAELQKMKAARAIDAAARQFGFFYADHHAVDAALVARVVGLARAFFAQDEAKKMRIPMSAGGLAWRGYFPAGGELTSGRPDWKEGSRRQHQRPRPALDPALLRPRFRHADPARARRRTRPGRQRPPLGRRQPPVLPRHLRPVRHRQDRKGVPTTERISGGEMRRVRVQSTRIFCHRCSSAAVLRCFDAVDLGCWATSASNQGPLLRNREMLGHPSWDAASPRADRPGNRFEFISRQFNLRGRFGVGGKFYKVQTTPLHSNRTPVFPYRALNRARSNTKSHSVTLMELDSGHGRYSSVILPGRGPEESPSLD